MSWDMWLVSGKNDRTVLPGLYQQSEEEGLRVLVADPALIQAGEELLSVFPPLEAAPEGEESPSPWSMTPEITDKQICLTLSYSRVDEFFEKAGPIFEKYELLGYDPQNNQVVG